MVVFQMADWWANHKNDEFGSLSQGALTRRNESIVKLVTLNDGDNYQSDKPYYCTFKGTGTLGKSIDQGSKSLARIV